MEPVEFKMSANRYWIAVALSVLFQVIFIGLFIYFAHSIVGILELTSVGVLILTLTTFNYWNKLRKANEINPIEVLVISSDEIILKYVDATENRISNGEIEIVNTKKNKFRFMLFSLLLFFPYFNFNDIVIKKSDGNEIIIDSFLFPTNKIFRVM